jgi:anthranilate phosphoribosyltransferase
MTAVDCVTSVCDGGRLTQADAGVLTLAMLRGELAPQQAGAALAAMRARGETADEVCGVVTVLRGLMRPAPFPGDGLIDTCGTGGDGRGTFNVSTVSAVVAAAAGCRVAKHCNRAVTGRCGSANLLEALGVRFDGGPDLAARALAAAGVAFLFAPAYHDGLRAIAALRRRLGTATIFNIAGPLANPARVRRQVVGVFSPQLVPVVAEVLRRFGAEHCLVVAGLDGTDEVSTTGPTRVGEVWDGAVREHEVTPEVLGVTRGRPSDLACSDVNHSAVIALDILSGRPSPARDAVMVNAGAALVVAGRALSFADGAAAASAAIDSGAASAVLQTLRHVSREAGE